MIYAIGDIHGHLDLLKAAHERVAADKAREGAEDATVVHVGDLVDRGPDSAGVVDYLLECEAAQAPFAVLKGNHDRMFTTFMASGGEDPRLRPDLVWLHAMLGGGETLMSYGVSKQDLSDPTMTLSSARSKVPPEHIAFLNGLALSYETEDCVFVHAGIRPGVPLAKQVEDDLLWIRTPFLDHTGPHPKLVVHGHTPVRRVAHHGNRVEIDTRAAYGGPLSAVVVEGRDVWLLTDEGRMPVRPQ